MAANVLIITHAQGKINYDEYGRILVRFHWGLDGAHSMRCRVSQGWSGNGWGGMVIPRADMEVVVEFIEGDPDQPLVTGCVYNGRNAVPYELPERLIPASLLQTLFSVRSEQQLMEQMNYNLMFHWFVGLGSTIRSGVKGARKSVRWTDFSPERAKRRAEGRRSSPRTATGCRPRTCRAR